jgi:hypothetical protein
LEPGCAIIGTGGRPEETVLRLFAPPTRTQRLVDTLVGVGRRRRLMAYASIAGGLAVLRPMLRRIALVTLLIVALLLRPW